MPQAARPQCAAQESLDAFQAALQETSRRMATAVDRAMLQDAGKMLTVLYQRRSHYGVAQAIGIVEEIRAEWRNHRGRLVAQIEAAVTRKERSDLAGRLRSSGARQVKESDQMGAGGVVGHCIEASF